jgi:hypothetical protein
MKRAAEKGLIIIGMKTQIGGRRRETSEPVKCARRSVDFARNIEELKTMYA